MNKQYLKKSLLRGIPVGLIIALAVILVRSRIIGAGYLDTLSSLHGILTLICIPAAFIAYYYYELQKKGEE